MAATWSLSTASVEAQINPFGRNSGSLNAEDLSLGKTAAAKLLNDDAAQPGTFETWENPKSGNGGTVSLVKAFDNKGMPCKTLRSRFHFKRLARDRVYTFNVCRIRTGEWKLF